MQPTAPVRSSPVRRGAGAGLAALLWLAATSARAGTDVPPGWFSGDLHVHALHTCVSGVDFPEFILFAMPPDLNVAAPLLFCYHPLTFERDLLHFRGKQDNPMSTAGQIVHYDLEVSHCTGADRLGHVTYLDLADIAFPQANYQGPIQDWAHAQGAVAAADHVQFFASGFHEFTPKRPAAQYEAPVGVALGRVDFLMYQPTYTEPWRFLWYSLLDSGFRPGIAASSDAGCLPFSVGEARTWARIEGGLSYAKFVRAVAAGRVVVAEGDNGFIDFQVEGVGTGEELALAAPGAQVRVEARLILPDHAPRGGLLELIRNHEVVAQRAYGQQGGVVELGLVDTVAQSSWYAARTAEIHSGAVFVTVAGRPIRASELSPAYYVAYLDWLEQRIRTGFFEQAEPTDDRALLADVAEAREIFEGIRREAVALPEPSDAWLSGLALGALALLRRGSARPR